MKKFLFGMLFFGVMVLSFKVAAAGAAGQTAYVVQVGDTWVGLGRDHHLSTQALLQANAVINPERQPAIGATIMLPAVENAQAESGYRPLAGTVALTLAPRFHLDYATLIRANSLASSRILPQQRLILPDYGLEMRDLPTGFTSLALSHRQAVPGQALGLRATTLDATQPVTVSLQAADGTQLPFDLFRKGQTLLGIRGTGAFYSPGEPLLTVTSGGTTWSQPWRMVAGNWEFQDITLTGEAAQITRDQILAERAFLAEIWNQKTPQAAWNAPFQLPINEYLVISSPYGTRRSYNDGGYNTYHEGLDFAAYGGTPVFATAAGTVVIAERLAVRGNAVIIDHGLGVFSGYYHLSALTVVPGEQVAGGQQVGAVGTTGFSTGNHLHWDFLVNGMWVDAGKWLEGEMGMWLLNG